MLAGLPIVAIPYRRVKNRSKVADRQFIGAEWFTWLRANHFLFRIRTRHDIEVPAEHPSLVRACPLSAIVTK